MKKFDNFISNLKILARAGEQDRENPFVMSRILSQFSLQFELGWKVLKRLSEYEGMSEGMGSPRRAARATGRYSKKPLSSSIRSTPMYPRRMIRCRSKYTLPSRKPGSSQDCCQM